MARKRKRYLRKSTEQADRQAKSHREQGAECDRKWGPLENPADLYKDSYSGTTFDRPDFRRLLADCLADPQPPQEPGRIEIYDPSRFGRPLKDGKQDTRAYRTMLWQFEDAGWRVEFVTLERSDDPLADELQILFHAYNASTFSVELSRKVRLGKKTHAEEGYWIHGVAPLGTLRVVAGTVRLLDQSEEPRPWEQRVFTNRADLLPGQYEVGRVLADGELAGHNEKVILAGSDALKHWRPAAERYLDGMSLQRGGKQLFAEGVRGYYEGVIDHTAMRNFLKHPALVGRIPYQYRDHDGNTRDETFEAKWSPLVDVDLWNAVQRRLAERGESQFAKNKAQEFYPLKPLCAHCQSPYWGSNRPDGKGGYVRVLRHSLVDERKHPEQYVWFKKYECSRYEIDAAEFEQAACDLIASRRGSAEFESNLHQLVHEEDTYRHAIERALVDAKREVSRAERMERATVQSLNEARADGKEGDDLTPFKNAVDAAQVQLRTLRAKLGLAQKEQASAGQAWTRMKAAIDETRSIAAAWDMLSLEEKAVIFRHWVVAAFVAVEKIPGRKRGHPKHAIFYLAGTPRTAAEVDDAAANASLISTITAWSVSAASESSSAATAEADPTWPSAHAECERTSGSESDSPDLNGGTAASSPQLPNATATFRRKPARPARRKGEPRENASQPDSSMDMRSISDGDAVPGCHPSEGNGSTPNGGSPGPRDANAGSDEGVENLRLKGHTSWQMSQPKTRLPISGRSSRGIGPRFSMVW